MTQSTVEIAVENAVKGLVFDTILDIVIKKIIAKVPFLGWPVINPVFTFIMGQIANLIYKELSLSVKFILIDLKTSQQVVVYEKSVTELKAKIETKNEAEIEKAKAEFKKNLSALIRFNRVAA